MRGLRVSRKRFRSARRGRAVAPKGRRLRRRVGTRVRFRLSEKADVTFRLQKARRAKGRLVGGKCVKRTRSNARRKKCTRYRTLRGRFTVKGEDGVNRFRFTGRFNGRRLRRGGYRFVGRATDQLGNKSGRSRLRFRIVR